MNNSVDTTCDPAEINPDAVQISDLPTVKTPTLKEAAAKYIDQGLVLTAHLPKSKKAYLKGWNKPETPKVTAAHWEKHPDDNIGCLLQPSGLITVDIDNKDGFVKVLKTIALPEVEQPFTNIPTRTIVSGKAGKGKIVFKIPTPAEYEKMGFSKDTKLEFHKLEWREVDGNPYCVFELRCGYLSDLLPPSIHPDTQKPYEWRGVDYFAPIPYDLLYLWLNWDMFLPAMERTDPNYREPVQKTGGRPRKNYDGRNYIEEWSSNQNLKSMLIEHGYKESSNPTRLLSPYSKSGSAGIVIYPTIPETMYSFHQSDPFGDKHLHDAYDVMAYFDYGGDKSKAFERVREDLGLDHITKKDELQAFERITGKSTVNVKVTYSDATLAARKSLHDKIANKQQCSDEEKNDYLKLERANWGNNHPINKNCRHIPPWEREPNQILRDISDTEYFSCNDIGRSRRFAVEVDGYIAHSEKMKSYLLWTGTHWTTENAAKVVREYIKNMAESFEYERPYHWIIDDKGDVKTSKEYESMCLAAGKEQGVMSVFRLSDSDPYVSAEFDTYDEIPFANGMFDFKTGSITPHKSEKHNTIVGNTALILDVEDDHFEAGEKFFDDISCHRPEWVKKMFELLGRCLRKGNKDQLYYVFLGKGANGKSVLLDWLKRALGDLMGSVSAAELSKFNRDQRQTSLVDNLPVKRIVTVKEAGKIEYDDELIKAITGENTDDIQLKRINTGMTPVKVSASVIFVTNNTPSFSEGGESMRRRTVCIPFDMVLDDDQIDTELIEKLATKEGNEWLLRQIIKHGLESLEVPGNFAVTMPQCIKECTRTMIENADAVYLWLKEFCEFGEGNQFRLSRSEAYQSFCVFTYEQGGEDPTDRKYWMKEKTFGERLAVQKGVKALNGQQRLPNGDRSKHVFEGIRWK